MSTLSATDSYKLSHKGLMDPRTEYIYSNMTPRSCKYLPVPKETYDNKAVFFGLQHFLKDYLVREWNEEFFSQPRDKVIKSFKRRVDTFLGPGALSMEHLEELHDLGYLPISIKALPEGARVNLRVPFFTIINTNPRFAWLTNYLETIISCEIWKPCTTATIGFELRRMVNSFALETVGHTNGIEFAIHGFEFRGMSGRHDAAISGAGPLLSFWGTDSLVAVDLLEESYNANAEKELIACSVPACYDDKTEILTHRGFVLFSDLKPDDKVAQYHENGDIDFVIPLKIHEYVHNGDMIHFTKDGYKYVDICVTPNHRMVRRKNDKIEYFEAGDFSYHNRNGFSGRNELIVSGRTTISGDGASEVDLLKVAFQADGSFASHKENYTGERTGTLPIRFSLKKERKKSRLESLLVESQHDFNVSETKNREGYRQYWVPTEEEFAKDFSWIDVSVISIEWAQDFIEELKYWDGSDLKDRNVFSYSSSNKSCVDMVQAICSIAGYKTQYRMDVDKSRDRMDQHCLVIMREKTTISGQGVRRNIVPYDGFVYCVSVPTKMIITRRNNRVVICGNSEHSDSSLGTALMAELEFFRKAITQDYPTGIVSLVSDTYDFFRVITEYATILKPEILARKPNALGLAKTVFRPDSGNPADIVCGLPILELKNGTGNYVKDLETAKSWMQEIVENKVRDETPHGEYGEGNPSAYFKYEGKAYKIVLSIDWNRHDKQFYYIDGVKINSCEEVILTPEQKGAIECLWEIFGGTITEKGYKLLHERVGLIYGDGCNPPMIQTILERLKIKDFASTNCVFGVGSFTYGCRGRDDLGIAIKATWAQVAGQGYDIYKDPKTDDGLKKSARGLLRVDKVGSDYVLTDRCTQEQEKGGELKEVFRDGKILYETSLSEIRSRINASLA